MTNILIPASGDFDAWPRRFDDCLAVDWDGSCKDTMTAKWLGGFNLAITETWSALKPYQKRIDEVCRQVNMIDPETAGVQRFVSLMIMMRQWAAEGLPTPELSSFFAAVEYVEAQGLSHGTETYQALMDAFGFDRTPIHWSNLSDEIIARSARDAVIFDHCRETLAACAGRCEILLVSASKTEAVADDLRRDEMSHLFAALLAQDFLPKAETLIGLGQRYRRVMLIGDTRYDEQAAAKAGAAFHRIRTGDEARSWREARDAIDRFLAA